MFNPGDACAHAPARCAILRRIHMSVRIAAIGIASAIVLTTSAANAIFDEDTVALNGVMVVVKSEPAGQVVVRTHTDKKGVVELSDLKPGEYEIDIDGPSLAKAMDTVVVTTERKAEDSPVNIGIGGSLFGGGGSGHSGSGHPGTPTGGGAGHGGSGGGAGGGVGVTIPIGGNPDTHPTAPSLSITISYPEPPGLYSTSPVSAVGQQEFSVSMLFCPDAKGDVRIHFTVLQGGDGHSGSPFGVGTELQLQVSYTHTSS
jgi:hypothetical protein